MNSSNTPPEMTAHRHRLAPIFAYLMTLTAAFVAAQCFIWLQIPLPWLTGPLLCIGILSVLNAPVVSIVMVRNLAQWAMGSALGLYFTPEILAIISQLWWCVALTVLVAIALGLFSTQFITFLNRNNTGFSSRQQLVATAYYAGAIGAASEMTLLAERQQARTDLVAASHSLRLMIVTLCIPFAVTLIETSSAGSSTTLAPLPLQAFQPLGFALFALITAAGIGVLHYFKMPNPWFLGPFFASVILAVLECNLSAMPPGSSSAAQLIIGVSLGVRFSSEFLKSAPFWAFSIALLSLCLIAISAGFGWLLSQFVPVDFASLLLATAPGGIVEMAITAKIFALSVPVVTAFQVTRLVAVLLLSNWVYRCIYREAPAPESTSAKR